MNNSTRKLLTVITEASLERTLVAEIKRLGARGLTITDVRGEGSRGTRNAAWDEARNIRIEIVCSEATAQAIADHLHSRYYAHYGMILFVSDVAVLRPDKF